MSHKPELDTAFSNVLSLLNLAKWHAMNELYSGPEEQRKRGADQLTALLIVTEEYAENALKDYDGRTV